MKNFILLALMPTLFLSCHSKDDSEPGSPVLPLAGTWKLFSGTLVEKGDTVVTDYTKGISFIKIINDTHFAFLQHDLVKGRDSAAVSVLAVAVIR